MSNRNYNKYLKLVILIIVLLLIVYLEINNVFYSIFQRDDYSIKVFSKGRGYLLEYSYLNENKKEIGMKTSGSYYENFSFNGKILKVRFELAKERNYNNYPSPNIEIWKGNKIIFQQSLQYATILEYNN